VRLVRVVSRVRVTGDLTLLIQGFRTLPADGAAEALSSWAAHSLELSLFF